MRETVREGYQFRSEHFGREVPAHAPAFDLFSVTSPPEWANRVRARTRGPERQGAYGRSFSAASIRLRRSSMDLHLLRGRSVVSVGRPLLSLPRHEPTRDRRGDHRDEPDTEQHHQRRHDLACRGHGDVVSVADGCHRLDSPPQPGSERRKAPWSRTVITRPATTVVEVITEAMTMAAPRGVVARAIHRSSAARSSIRLP